MTNRRVIAVCVCGHEITASETRSRTQPDLCADCRDDADDDPVAGTEIQVLREAHGMSREQLAERLNEGRNGDSYENGTLTVEDVRRMESALVHKNFLARVERLLKGDNMTNGVSDESAAIQSAQSAASKARETFESDNADAMTLAATFDAALDKLLADAPVLSATLRARRDSYWRFVVAERQRARLAGDESRESEMTVKRYARDFRSLIGSFEVLSEYSISVPNEIDPADSLVPRPSYLNAGAEPVPMRRNK